MLYIIVNISGYYLNKVYIYMFYIYIGGFMWLKRYNFKFEILYKYIRIKDFINFWVEKKKIDIYMNKVDC